MSVIIKISEKERTRQIRDYLKYRGVFHWKNFSTLGSVPGIPDIIGCLKKRCECGRIHGVFLGVEVKTPDNSLSKPQEKFIMNLKDAGGIAFKATSVEDLVVRGI
ncbi:MAG: hypothetical protein COS89_03385 [Deltaproteobacteria bacterium CG07_land_8_20_14_0_80_38_7]|nr:MAG: hypothetical protein COS89_03385 [Deltaproteobacteria bacterium CG07_land_8_20_14_0_80_38_7]